MGINLKLIDLGINFVVKQIALGDEYTCALSTLSEVKCWGWNDFGQLGADNSNETINFGEGFVVKSIDAGWYHTCAVSVDNRIKCWEIMNMVS